MKNTATAKKTSPAPAAKTSKKPNREHWTVEFFKRVDAWGIALKDSKSKHSGT